MNVTIDNICELIFTTNNANAVKISQHDRRYVVFEADTSVANNSEIFAPIITAVRDEKVMRNFFEYLKNIDVRGFKASEMRPKTKIYKEMRAASLSTVQNFMIARWDKMNKDEDIVNGSLYIEYKDYCSVNHKESRIMADNKFSQSIVREVIGIKNGVRKTINKKQHKCFGIDYKKLGDWVFEMRGDVDEDDKLEYPEYGSEEECDDI
jgi:hypothetical protein